MKRSPYLAFISRSLGTNLFFECTGTFHFSSYLDHSELGEIFEIPFDVHFIVFRPEPKMKCEEFDKIP
jgi:hypothetical protein